MCDAVGLIFRVNGEVLPPRYQRRKRLNLLHWTGIRCGFARLDWLTSDIFKISIGILIRIMGEGRYGNLFDTVCGVMWRVPVSSVGILRLGCESCSLGISRRDLSDRAWRSAIATATIMLRSAATEIRPGGTFGPAVGLTAFLAVLAKLLKQLRFLLLRNATRMISEMVRAAALVTFNWASKIVGDAYLICRFSETVLWASSIVKVGGTRIRGTLLVRRRLVLQMAVAKIDAVDGSLNFLQGKWICSASSTECICLEIAKCAKLNDLR